MWDDDDFSFKPLPTRFGDVDTTLGRKALFNMGDTHIASRTIETAGGELQVQKQGALVRMVMIAKKIVSSECVPGPLTEVSRTYYAVERIYSTERIQFIDVKRLKTLVVNNGVEDITFCFSSPTTPAVASGTGKCFVESSFSTRAYHPIEAACANTPATITATKGVMHAEFAIKRIAAVTFKYKNIPFTYRFATPASVAQSSSAGIACANSNVTEKSFLSRALTSNKLSKTVLSNISKALDFALNLTGEGLLGPAEFLKGTLTKFYSYDKARISDLSEIVMFGQGWHGKGLATMTNISFGGGYVVVPTVGTIYNAASVRHGFLFRHPEAAPVTTPAALLALGLEFKEGRIWGGLASFINTGTELNGLSNCFLWASPGAGTRRVGCVHGDATLTQATVSLYVYPETEYGVAPVGFVLLSTVTMTHDRNVYSNGITIAPSPDGRKVLITLFSSTRPLCVQEVTLDTALANITSESAWVETDEYVTAAELRPDYSADTLTWSAGRFVEFYRDETTISYDQIIDNVSSYTLLSRVTKKMHFCVAAYDKLGRRAIVTLEVRYGALANYAGVYANGGTRETTGTWTYYNSASQNIATGNWAYSIAPKPAGMSPPDTAPISYPTGATVSTPNTSLQNRWRFSGFSDGATVDIMPTDLTSQSNLAASTLRTIKPTVWEARSRAPDSPSVAAAVSRIRAAADVLEYADVICVKASSTESGLSFANWDYDQETSSFVHDCFAVM